MNKPEKVSAGTGGVLGFGVGALAGNVVLSVAGVSGLSAAGIASGLAAIGETMVGGAVTFAVLPAVGTVAGAWGGYKAYQWWADRGGEVMQRDMDLVRKILLTIEPFAKLWSRRELLRVRG